MAKVSIVIPVYNVEEYLKECLDSVQRQTLKDIEIICVDDGSTDSSGKILDEYAAKDTRFRVIHKSNEGYGKAMNVGMAAATAPYVGIVESDDWIEPHMYETLSAIMEEKKVDVIKADFYQFYNNMEGNSIEEYMNLIEESNSSLYEKAFSICEHEEAMLFPKFTWSGLYNSEFLRRENILHNETPGASYQDNGFWFQTFVKAKQLYFVNLAFYHYRIDNPNASTYSTAKIYAVRDEYDFVNHILDTMGEAGKPFYKWSRYIRIRDNIMNVGRVEEEKQIVLAEMVKEDFLAGQQLGDIDITLFPNWCKAEVFDILVDSLSYVKRIQEQKEKVVRATSAYNAIILYGAGKVGRQIQGLLRTGRINTKIQAFAVTELAGNQEELLGIPVRRIDDLQEYKEDALVIISVGAAIIPAVEEKLQELGFKHYIHAADLNR